MWTVPRGALTSSRRCWTRTSRLRWVQLPYAGIEPFVHLVQDDRTWTCGKGIFAEPVAELALTLALAGMRGLGTYVKSTTWLGESGRNLIGGKVTILGGGGIASALVRMLKPFNCHITVVRNRIEEMDGVDEVLAAERYVDALAGADLVVLALPLTAETEEMISLTELEMMESHAWIVNISRGKHIVTDDLVWALQNGVIGGAGARCHPSRAIARRSPAVDHAELHHHAAHRRNAGDGRATAVRAHHDQHPSVRSRQARCTGAVYPDLGY